MAQLGVAVANGSPTVDLPAAAVVRTRGDGSSRQGESGRQNNFDLLRVILASMVLLSHSFPLVDGDTHRELLVVATHRQLGLGGVAVGWFFTISGFLITASWLRCSSQVEFFRRRISRIYPAFIGVSVFMVAVVGSLAVRGLPIYLRHFNPFKFALHCFVLDQVPTPGLFASNPFPNAVNGSLWTVRYEFICYAVVAALGLLGWLARRGMTTALFVFTLSLYWAQSFSHGGLLHDHALPLVGSVDHWPRLLSYFLAGVVYFQWRDRIPHSRRLLWISAGTLVACSLWTHCAALVLPVVGTYMLMHVAFSRTLRMSAFARRGDMSYGIYLYAWPVQQLWMAYLGPQLDWYSLFALSLPTTWLLAFCSWHLVEKRFLSRAVQHRRPVPVR